MKTLYLPGASVLYRLPAWSKLLFLAVCGVGVSIAAANPMWQSPVLVLLFFLVLCGYLGLPGKYRVLVREIWGLRWLLLLVALPQLIFLGLQQATLNTARVLLLVLFAQLITFSTKITELLDVLEALAYPAKYVGVAPEKVGLLLTLTIASIPVVLRMLHEIRMAQRVRGVRGVRHVPLPLVVAVLQHADEFAQALKARGFQ